MKEMRFRDQIDPDEPLRLQDAVKIAFPMGGMTVSGLRTEIGRGRLTAERIAGKLFVTLNGIKAMRVLCREEAPAASHQRGNTTDSAISSRDALKAKLKRLMEN